MQKRSVVRNACIAVAVVLAASEMAVAQGTDARTADILRRAIRYQFQFRTGQMDIIPEYVAMLEEATKTDPENAELWNAMGVAYLAQGARAMMPGGKPADAIPAIQKGPAALERALRLNPNHAEALATHGGMQALMGSFFQQAPAVAANGVAEMNRAIELAPRSSRVRLQRAFSGINLPDAMRNRTAEAEDLDFLIAVANGTRAGDYIRLMRGDLYAETGTNELAREQYRTVVTSASPAGAEAASRLAALDQGGVPAADIKKLRQAAGANCLMCHGK
jgi:tetratricopeptide (TPR) repeat protein